MRTIQLIDQTVIVLRHVAAVGPIVHKERPVEEGDDIGPDRGPVLPTFRWCEFDIVFIGGTKLYPAREYGYDEVQAARDRNKIVAALETRVNEL